MTDPTPSKRDRAPARRPLLVDRAPPGVVPEPDEILERFLAWVADIGLEPYPAQEEALLELMSGRHVVLSTPTGSGKSLVAEAVHFKALCEGRRSFYTSPTKALANEKFFALCEDFGPENVGMLTGDASINPAAPILCCTAEVLANMALRRGEALDAPYVVMDEFHYYSDRDRGAAWQIPLLTLPNTVFLLMSATLGNTAAIEQRLREHTRREVALVYSEDRPVPLDFEYRDTPMHETVESLLSRNLAPLYIVNFTQRECAEQAQVLTSANVCTREEKRRIAEAIRDFRFDSPYGKDMRRFIRHGIGAHHAGLLPKYRLLVEQLSQQGLLKVICGTDTLGVGVNIPIRTVVFSKLCKFDGEKTTLLRVRDFKQIAGRAGRKGFDDRGCVVCQAPEHAIENRRIVRREAARGARGKRRVRKKAPRRNFVPWNAETFRQLVARSPEPLVPRFEVTHGMLIDLLQRESESGEPGAGYRALIDLVGRAHADARSKRRQRRRAALLFRSLRRAGIVEVVRDSITKRRRVRVSPDLQRDFSLHHTQSLYLVDAIWALDPDSPSYPLELLGLVEAILEDPTALLVAQARRARQELVARLKAQRVPYEERMRKLAQVTHPKPNAEFIYSTFDLFAKKHPWMRHEDIRPKSIARELYEDYHAFDTYVRLYGIARSEGLLLRYLNEVYKALMRTVPGSARTDGVYDVQAFLRTTLQRVDSSLVEEWESLLEPGSAPADTGEVETRPGFDLAQSPKTFAARVRSELHRLVRALARRDYGEAARCVRPSPDDPWDAARIGASLADFYAEHAQIVFGARARLAEHTLIKPRGSRRWDVHQTLLDPAGDGDWSVEGEVDLRNERNPAGPLVALRRIGPS